MHFIPRFIPLVLVAFVSSVAAQTPDASLAHCAEMNDSARRLAWYDELAGRVQGATRAAEGEIAQPPSPATAPMVASASPLSERWQLEPATRKGLYGLHAHKQNYFLPVTWTDRVNNTPFRPGTDAAPGENLGLNNVEAKFQLSLKTMALQGLFIDRADLWLGYTQQNQWQVYSGGSSRPFRETVYEPEMMLVFKTDYELAGLHGRMVNFGLVHQSNGRSDPLSRSWNRAYVQVGLERGNFTLLVRPWYRFKERPSKDDNPDITSFVGRGDVLAIYKYGRQEFSLLARSSFSLHAPRGSGQVDWSFPLYGGLKGYVQIFSGYGESLIDYNARQTVFGAGILLTDWL
jgi:phospholipase A1